ncbi:MAG: amidohydrolase [Candidatus Brocadiia bacterium]
MTHPTEPATCDLLLRNAILPDGSITDIGIRGDKVVQVGGNIAAPTLLDCTGLLAVPAMYNAHTHAAMVLFRGWGDDMPLHEWLQHRIWPAEARMTPDDVYAGTRLACVEMLRSGCAFFNDMYWHPGAVIKAAHEVGVRALVSGVIIDKFTPATSAKQRDDAVALYEECKRGSGLTRFALGPHAIYTVCEESLRWCGEFSRAHRVPLHIHLSETEKEVADCRAEYGCSPVEFLDLCGCLGALTHAAHCVWLSEGDIRLLADRRTNVVHLPTSNMKLAVGERFPYRKLIDAGVRVTLGTDGAASNNNLDLFEAMKFAALGAKARSGNPLEVTAQDVWRCASVDTAASFGFDLVGPYEGALADIALLDAWDPMLVPSHDRASNLVYSASGGVTKAMIIAGQLRMWNREVAGAREIAECAERASRQLCR